MTQLKTPSLFKSCYIENIPIGYKKKVDLVKMFFIVPIVLCPSIDVSCIHGILIRHICENGFYLLLLGIYPITLI